MPKPRRRILLVQLPIPPLGPQPVRGNVPLAAGYLKLFARSRGLEASYDIDILPPAQANTLGDQALIEAILSRDPWMVGFTCYLWNIDRTLWIANRLKQCRPDLQIVIGGPEVTADNAWVLEHPVFDYAVIGEGEQTFTELLQALTAPADNLAIDGLYKRRLSRSLTLPSAPRFRKPLPNLEEVSSPYLAGILDAAEEQMLLLETIRGCVFKCKFCYYPKSYDGLYFLSEERILANLRHAREHGAREVVLLDPTLNQRKDFADFLRLLIRGNPDRQFTYFGELRAEGITTETARLLHLANFTEVEIGLQSIDPVAQELMDRRNSLRAFERGAKAMLDEGIKVKVDLIIGLPGDTADSIRRGMLYLRDSGLYSDVQVFNLSILPGTAFRQEAETLGLTFQPRPPYYVLKTPTLCREEMFHLMQEAQDIFEMEWDPLPPPMLTGPGFQVPCSGQQAGGADLADCRFIDLDHGTRIAEPETPKAQAFTLWLRSSDFHRHRHEAAKLIARILDEDPFTTLQVVLEPTPGCEAYLTRYVLETLMQACQRNPTYLDRFYALQPGRPIGAKRLIVVLTAPRSHMDEEWLRDVAECATLIEHRRNPCSYPLFSANERLQNSAADKMTTSW